MHPLMALAFITKYMVKANLSFYCKSAFLYHRSELRQLIPELSKITKVIAIEFQGHGHFPYSDRKLDIITGLAP